MGFIFLQKTSLPMMLYLADNLAYIPYTVVDEPLFVIHHIDIMISVSGSNLLQTFKEVRILLVTFANVLYTHSRQL